jgi:O-acetyl-ADP-ribose deacetylase
MWKKDLLQKIRIIMGNITEEDADAIVNAANPSLLGGGGVDGAIHLAAGPGLLEECRKLGGCMHGEARITGGYNLKAKFVIHTPGPVYRDGNSGEGKILANSYYNSMLLAKQYKLKSISFPAISTGIYGFPRDKACSIAFDTVLDFMLSEDYPVKVNFVMFDRENYNLYNDYIKGLKNELS